MKVLTLNSAVDVKMRAAAFVERLNATRHRIAHIVLPKLVDRAFVDFFNRNSELGLPQWYINFVKKYFSSCIGYVEMVDAGWKDIEITSRCSSDGRATAL